jgi:hypothetical protein
MPWRERKHDIRAGAGRSAIKGLQNLCGRVLQKTKEEERADARAAEFLRSHCKRKKINQNVGNFSEPLPL